MEKSDLNVGDRVVVARMLTANRARHRAIIGQTGTVERVYKTKDETIVRLDNGEKWWMTPCNLDPLTV